MYIGTIVRMIRTLSAFAFVGSSFGSAMVPVDPSPHRSSFESVSVRRLFRIATDSKESSTRRTAAARALFGDTTSFGPVVVTTRLLQEEMTSPSPRERRLAAHLLVSRMDRNSFSIFNAGCHDSDAGVRRYSAIGLLATLPSHDADSERLLTGMLDDFHASVRITANLVLANLRGWRKCHFGKEESYHGPLRYWFADENFYGPNCPAIRLAEREAWRQLLHDRNGTVREMASDALKRGFRSTSLLDG
jgi:hypothetical protein